MKSWEEIADPLVFTIKGKAYEIPELGYQEMLTIQKVKAGEPTDLDDQPADASWRLVMGTAWDEMVADNVPGEALARAGLATLAFFEAGREAAELIWEKGIDPKAMLAALQSTAQKQPSSTGAASTTPSTARSSGTSSRPAGRKKAAQKKTASRS